MPGYFGRAGRTKTRRREKGERFRALHEGEPFLIPNPWDAGSAKLLEDLGFKALATSSSAFAFTLGRRDGETTLQEVVDHAGAIDRATELPTSIDLENGYGPRPEDVTAAIELAAAAGAVGGSIEDYDPEGRIYELGEAVERVSAAVEAARGLEFPFTLTARAENHIRGNPDLDDTIARLQAYEAAGADVLYAPGLRDGNEIRPVCEGLERPVNVLAHTKLTMAIAVEHGAQRVSVGGSLAWTALQAMRESAEAMRDRGDFSSLASPAFVRELLG